MLHALAGVVFGVTEQIDGGVGSLADESLVNDDGVRSARAQVESSGQHSRHTTDDEEEGEVDEQLESRPARLVVTRVCTAPECGAAFDSGSAVGRSFCSSACRDAGAAPPAEPAGVTVRAMRERMSKLMVCRWFSR